MGQFKNFITESEILDIFDAKNGIGQVPKNIDVNYFGFKKYMTPNQFRSLVPKGISGENTRSFVIKALRQGKKLGQPFLQVKWDEENKVWLVRDHEGRSRSDAIQVIYGQELMEVHIFPDNVRGRNITPEMKESPFIPQQKIGLWEHEDIRYLVEPVYI